jgi:hypothetical protein
MISLNDWSLPAACAAQGIVTSIIRSLRDVATLRMVLRGADAAQRAALIDAHRAWRRDSPPRPVRRRG